VELSREKLEAIIQNGNFDDLMGLSETAWFECKKQPYQLSDESAKRELAKDVSSLANAVGGKILIGIKTKQSSTHFGDEVESVSSFGQELVDTTQYKNIISAWIYPQIEAVDVKWFPTSSGTNKGVVVIDIPTQKDATKPFLIVKTLDGAKSVEIVFGYAERKGDSSKPLSVVELQAALKSGFNYENQLKERLDGMETLLRAGAERNDAIEQKKSTEEALAKRIEQALNHSKIAQSRNIIISALPDPRGQLKTIFLGSDESIRRRLENPERLRYGGWDLTHHDQAKIIRGDLLHVANGDTKTIDLYRDGTMIFAALADSNFLAWGRDSDQRINSLALIEVIYSFLAFYRLVLNDFQTKPTKITFRIELHNMHLDGKKSFMLPYHLESNAQSFSLYPKEAPDNDGSIEISVPAEPFEPFALTYQLVREIYLWFGLEEDKIPYMKDEQGIKSFDTTTIVKS
jgi:hypothetical protein